MEANSDSDTNVSTTSHIPTSLVPQPSASVEVMSEECVSSNSPMCGSASPSDDTNKEENACVSSQQHGSPSSDEDEDESSSEGPDHCDNGSEISEFSDFSQESWQPVQGPISWVQEQMRRGQSPRKILEDLVPSGTVIPEGLDPIMLWKIIINIVSEPPKRKKLNDINTLDDVLRLLNTSKKIIVLTGAGVSVSCGIPDFRSRGGVYARLAKDFPNLPDPQAMFDIHFFRNDPRPFFKFAREIYPGQFKPSQCHRFIRLLEEKGKLLRNYTQNIDTLEQVAGIQRVVQCHGSFATATCTVCGHKVDSNAIKEDIFNQVIPRCTRCSPSEQSAVMKPDIVFFGESLPEHFHNQMAADKDECDLLIVIGSSLKVRPVALIPNSLPGSIPQILINRERLHYLNFDVELLGNCDEIIGELCRCLGPGWEELAAAGPPISEVLMSNLPTPPASPHSEQSRDRWDDASSPAISSSEAAVKSLKNTCDLPSEEKEIKDQSEPIETSEHCTEPQELNTLEDDVDVQEVSTSQSEPNLTKLHKAHHHHFHHRHSLKRQLSSVSTTLDVSAEQVDSNNSSSSDRASDAFCSPKGVETLVSACHKKDVMYLPTEKSHEHHGFHTQQSHDRSKSHVHQHQHGQSSVNEKSRFPGFKHTCMPSPPYNNNMIASHTKVEMSKDVSNNHDVPTGLALDKSELETSEKTVQNLPSCSNDSVTAVGPETDDDGCPKIKKPRISREDSSEAIEERKKSTVSVGENSNMCDSLSNEESLDNIRKMWHSRCRVSLAQRLEGNQVLFLPPSRYVFKGAEVFSGSSSEDSDESDDDEESTDDDDSSVDNDAEKSQEDVLQSKESPEQVKSGESPEKVLASEKPQESVLASEKQHTAKELDSHATVEKNSCQQTLPPASAVAMETDIGMPVQNVHGVQIEDCTVYEKDISDQHGECTPLSDVQCPQNKLSDGSTICPVSSTEDFYLEQSAQISNRLHSLQDQRD